MTDLEEEAAFEAVPFPFPRASKRLSAAALAASRASSGSIGASLASFDSPASCSAVAFSFASAAVAVSLSPFFAGPAVTDGRNVHGGGGIQLGPMCVSLPLAKVELSEGPTPYMF